MAHEVDPIGVLSAEVQQARDSSRQIIVQADALLVGLQEHLARIRRFVNEKEQS